MCHELENPHWEHFREVRRKLGSEIEKAKHNHWMDWLEKSSDTDLWTVHRYVTAPIGDSGKSRIPDLEVTTTSGSSKASNNKEKGQMLARTFFLQKTGGTQADSTERTKGGAHLQGRCNHEGPDQKSPRKAQALQSAGLDGIPNIVLTRCTDILIDRL